MISLSKADLRSMDNISRLEDLNRMRNSGLKKNTVHNFVYQDNPHPPFEDGGETTNHVHMEFAES